MTMHESTGAAVALEPALDVPGRPAEAGASRPPEAGVAVDPGNEAPAQAASALRVTVLTSLRPRRLSKRFALEADGTLLKQPGGALVEGEATIRTPRDLGEFAELLAGLGADQALAYGIPDANSGRVLSRGAFEAAGRPAGSTTRTRDRFAWAPGAGVMMIDHDPDGEERLGRDELIALLEKAAPGLADADLLWWPSASSHICDRRTGQDLTGLRGQRVYLAVTDARDIPRAGKALVDRLWAEGHGRIAVSAAGAALERCPVDACVWQPERLDFAAGAACDEGLEQRRGMPVPRPGLVSTVDTRTVLPDVPEIAAEADRRRREARLAAQPELQATRETYCERRADEMLCETDRADPEARKKALAVARRAVDSGVLGADWPVEIEVRPGVHETRTVSEILDARSRYHGALTRDPLEPGYDGGRTVGKLFLLDATPTLFSFARGGRTFRLVHAPQPVEIPQGKRSEAVDATMEVLRQAPGVFDFGGRIAVVEGGRIETLDEHALAHLLGGLVAFRRWRARKNAEPELEALDPPASLVRQILSLGRRSGLRQLTGVVTAPTLRADGSVLASPGYDEATGLFHDPTGDDPPEIPATPTQEQTAAALSVLMRPFDGFPFVDAGARGACLAALLTAVLRRCLPTAPAFAIDAPVQGSGKTLLASCIAALATGQAPEVWPHTAGRDDEEIRKRLLTVLQGGAGALVWDNVVGIMDSAALAAALTAPNYTDRMLGKSESVSVPNRALVLLTGNNLCLAGDLPRRVITCRIDPETATPFARRFDLSPLDFVLANRMELVVAALTLVRGALCAEGPRAGGRMASFEAWDDHVRQTVCWIDRTLAPGRFGDPMDLVRAAQATDPEQDALRALLEALRSKFGERWFTTKDVQKPAYDAAKEFALSSDTDKTLAEALADIGSDGCLKSSRSIGKVLANRADRIAGGLRLRKRSRDKSSEFRVEVVEEEDGHAGRFTRFTRFVSGRSCTSVAPLAPGDRSDASTPHTPDAGPREAPTPDERAPLPEDFEDFR